jgi:hypothetical protein
MTADLAGAAAGAQRKWRASTGLKAPWHPGSALASRGRDRMPAAVIVFAL